jgi:hypothetical protein
MRLGTALLSQVTATGAVAGFAVKIDYETGRSFYQKYTPANFLNSLTALAELAVSPGSCGVFQYASGEFVDPVPVTGLNAGAAINVSGGGSNKTLANSAVGHYETTFVPLGLPQPPPYLTPGSTYGLDNGSGGADVGAFKFSTALPPAITWTNKPTAATISRSQDLRITWSGGDPATYVYVIGNSPIDSTANTGAEFVCVAQNAAGGLTVPAPILSALPVSSNISAVSLPIMFPGGELIVNASTTIRSSAPGLDVFLVGTSSGDAKFAFAFQ